MKYGSKYNVDKSGFIKIYSERNSGPTVHIYFPRHAGKVAGTHAGSKAPTPEGLGEIILVVEDDPSILNLTQKILSGLGYSVLPAGTPKQALELAEKHTGDIHLLITDVIMPEMNGRELAEQLQSRFPDIKRLFMSGYTANVIAHHGVLDAGVHFIQKPFSKKIWRQMSERFWMRPRVTSDEWPGQKFFFVLLFFCAFWSPFHG